MHTLYKILIFLGILVTLAACGQVRQLEAEAARLQAEAARNSALAEVTAARAAEAQAQADLTRASGEVELLKAAAAAVQADQQASTALLSGFGLVVGTLLLGGMLVLPLLARQARPAVPTPGVAPLAMQRWRAEAQHWHTLALFLAALLRARAQGTPSAVERRALALVDHERAAPEGR